ncbi:restriction endonuclease subunit S [Leptolyngbya sp. GB2-A1]|uniref:restriction endonuclease subunit S n=1 Tax=unclassified Leptolyngbya TaxID=2650499 RepID=UPI003297E073
MDATDLNQEVKREWKPKLRFPEFRGAGEWEEKKIGALLVETLRPLQMQDEEEYSLVTVKRRYGGVVSRGKLKGKDIKVKFQFSVCNNDFLISKRQIVHNACGLVPKELEGSIVSNEYSVLTPRKNCDVVFFNYFSQQPKISESFLLSSVGIVIEKMLFKLDTWLGKKFLFPPFQEQQKIADCLFSIDNRITAEIQKLDTLKAHKKGLMQQLFPAEGETLPKLRFSEFCDAPEWEEKKLGSLVEIFSGYAPSSHKLSSTHCCPYVKVEDMNNCSKYQSTSREYAEKSTKDLPIGSVIFPKRGAAIMGNKVRIAAVPFYIDSNMMALFPHKTSLLSSEFLYYLIFTQQLSKIADTSSIPQINNKHIIAYTVAIPSLLEQQKIADCLSSLDDLITAQAQKIDTLKAHKKGLMQQLFPVLDKVIG